MAAVVAGNVTTGVTALAKRFCRLLSTPRFSHRQWLKLLYADTCQVVEDSDVDPVIVALDPVNLAYAERIEGISTVYKSTPPEFITWQTEARQWSEGGLGTGPDSGPKVPRVSW